MFVEFSVLFLSFMGAGALIMQMGTIYRYRSEAGKTPTKDLTQTEIDEQVKLENEDK